MTYAQNTLVSVDKTKAEIERLIKRSGAISTAFANYADRSSVAFVCNDRHIRFDLPLPDKLERRFLRDGYGRPRPVTKQVEAWEQACRAKWRALFLVIKAKLEAVESGIETFEDAFLPYIVTPDGNRFGDYAKSAIASMYATGRMLPLLPAPNKQ